MEQPICLYLRLEQGRHPDIDIVAEVTAAFGELIREVAFLVDPSLDLRIEFESGTEGSLSLNAIIRYLKEKVPDPVVRGTILGVVLTFFTKEFVSALIGLGVGVLFVSEESISQADIDRIATEVARRVEEGAAKPQAQQVYRVIEKDEAITGVGVTLDKRVKPADIVERYEFRERAGYDVEDIQTEQTRTKTTEDVIVLVSPVLELNQRHRKWRFLRHGETFNATMDDPVFLNEVLTGRTRIPMVAGIELSAVLEITETKRGIVWEVTERRVLGVRDARPPAEHPDLFPPKGE